MKLRCSTLRVRLCTVLIVLNLLFIWGNSLMPGSVSSAISGWVRDLLSTIFPGMGNDQQGHGLLRKIAHFSEFCMLGILLRWLYSMLLCRNAAVLGLVCGLLAACVDEGIQLFVPGRNPSLIDVGIDTAGVLLGIVLLQFGHTIYKQFLFWRKRK